MPPHVVLMALELSLNDLLTNIGFDSIRPVITSLNACNGCAVNARSDDDTAAHQMVFMLHHAFGAAFLVHDFFIRPGVIMLCHGMLAREGALII
ncbi:MAG: hypothetical protein GJ671_00060 [Alteromonadaceae bacterium]|nr:hypothetical protein [Alteromonadaceae bacterium]